MFKKNKGSVVKCGKLLYFCALILFAAGSVSYYVFFVMDVGDRYKLAKNPLGYRVLANWHSLRKITNITQLPYWLHKTKLETYSIFIPIKELDEMNSSKPISGDRLSYVRLNDEDKHYVTAKFFSPEDSFGSRIKIRYRGTNNNNWDAEKTAFRIKFPKDALFQGQRSLNLFLPYDRAYYGESLASYRAEKLGLFSAKFKFVRIKINGKDMGVYLASEPWSREYLAKNRMIDTNNVFSNKDGTVDGMVTRFSTKHVNDWKSYTAENETDSFEELNALFKILDGSDSYFLQRIESILDLDMFYKWQIVNTLSGSNHQTDNGNSTLLFKKETGKFQLVPWDVNLGDSEKYNIGAGNVLMKRILSHKPFFDEFKHRLSNYTEDESNLKDDLKFYDELHARLKVEFYKDQAKLHNDIMYNSRVKSYKEEVIKNFEIAKKISQFESFPGKYDEKYILNRNEEAEYVGTFEDFDKVFLSRDEFIRENSQFKKHKSGVLLSGVNRIKNNTIIPKDIKLYIYPGTKLVLSSNASIISYSPVEAIGSQNFPIIVEGEDQGDPWGVFAVINTGEEKSVFNNMNVSGGSSVTVNGVPFLSQFSLHNANAEVSNSVFENGRSDDGFHAILGSVDITNSIFRNNLADSIDLDFVENSRVVDSVFYNKELVSPDGDAIDLSGTRNIFLLNNEIKNFGDKCISVGEGAEAFINNNILSGCDIGIAVKDGSKVKAENMKIMFNKTHGIALYRKKPELIFGGELDISNSVVWENNEDVYLDKYSNIFIKDSVIDGGHEGINIVTTLPDIKDELPPYITDRIYK